MKYLFIILIAFSFVGCDGEEPTRIVYAEFTVISNPSAYILQTWFGGGVQSHTDIAMDPIPIGFTLTSSEYSWVKGYNCTASSNLSGLGSPEDCELEIKFYVDGDLKKTEIVDGNYQSVNFIIP